MEYVHWLYNSTGTCYRVIESSIGMNDKTLGYKEHSDSRARKPDADEPVL